MIAGEVQTKPLEVLLLFSTQRCRETPRTVWLYVGLALPLRDKGAVMQNQLCVNLNAGCIIHTGEKEGRKMNDLETDAGFFTA